MVRFSYYQSNAITRMAYKVLGNRVAAGVSYERGQILSDEAFAASQLVLGDDAVKVADSAAPAPQAMTNPPKPDEGAELDSEKKEGSESTGSPENAPEQTQDKELTVTHVLTESDLEKNPALASEGLKVGDEITLPAVEIVADQAYLDANPDAVAHGLVLGAKVLVAKGE